MPRRVWFSAPVLVAACSIVLNVIAVDAPSGATEEVQLVGPVPMTVTTTGAAKAQASTDAPADVAAPDDAPADDRAPVADGVAQSAAPSLGRTIMLDIARQPASAGAGAVFAYTPAEGDDDTTPPLAPLNDARLWRKAGDGMAPVSPVGGPALGYAYPHDGVLVRPLAVSDAATTVVSNLAAGGVTWEWTDGTGTQFLNHYDLGREMQASFFVRTSDGRKLNPTEAGDRYADLRVAPDLRHSSPLVSATVEGSRQTTMSVPLEWSPPRVDPRAGNGHPVIYPDMRLGKDVELAYRGHATVARYTTILTLPAATHDGDLEAPTAYLRSAFSRLYSFDARTRLLGPIAPTPFDRRGIDWAPPSGWGGLIAADAGGTHALGIYAVTTTAGGTITRFTAHDFHVKGGPDGAADVGTMKLRALRIGDFPAGTTRTTAYVVTGSLASVQRDMAALASEGIK